MQLDLLLQSLKRVAEIEQVYVIWKATDSDHDEAYEICFREHPETQALRETSSTPSHVRDLLNGADFACFFTDDDIFYRQPTPIFALDQNVLCHSFRLGRNTTWCYPHARSQNIPESTSSFEESLVWRWQEAEGDFSYPGSLDGHIFRASHLRRALLTCREDANPNRIEEHLDRWVRARLAGEFPFMAAETKSSLVGLPLNIVNQTNPNRNGEAYPWTADNLLRRYLEGQRIALDRLDFSDVHGAHQEIDLVFR